MKKSSVLTAFLIFALLLSSLTAFAVNETETVEPETETETETEIYTEVANEVDTDTETATDTEIETEKHITPEDEIPYGDFQEAFNPYEYKSFSMMTSEEARMANVPEGYSGYVLKLVGGSSGVGMGLDLTKYRVTDIESITFRIYCPSGTKNNGVRLTNTSNNSWIMLADPGATEEWVEVVLSESSNFNTTIKDFSVFDDGNGYCKRVNFVIRRDGSGDTIVYIDHITVKLRDPDIKAPVINYDGETVINTTAGKTFSIDITAYDEYDKSNVSPEYIFSEGAVDENGNLLEGEHTCTVRFTDKAGNFSDLDLILKVDPKDVEAPILSWAPQKIYANVGMRPVITVTATDDRDGEIGPTIVWSEGALDSRGRFTEGEHTLTITAVDATGNKTEKIIPVIVTSGIPATN